MPDTLSAATQSRFDACLAFSWRPDFDGQPLHNTAHDAGGWTAFGVTLSTFAAWRAEHGISPTTADDLGKASKQDLADPLRAEFWLPPRCDAMPVGVDLLVWDFGFGSGPGRSARILQRVLGVQVDGWVGPQTIAAAHAADRLDLIRHLGAAHEAFYRGLADFRWFGNGWTRRNDARIAIALAS